MSRKSPIYEDRGPFSNLHALQRHSASLASNTDDTASLPAPAALTATMHPNSGGIWCPRTGSRVRVWGSICQLKALLCVGKLQPPPPNWLHCKGLLCVICLIAPVTVGFAGCTRPKLECCFRLWLSANMCAEPYPSVMGKG